MNAVGTDDHVPEHDLYVVLFCVLDPKRDTLPQ